MKNETLKEFKKLRCWICEGYSWIPEGGPLIKLYFTKNLPKEFYICDECNKKRTNDCGPK